MNDIKLVYTVCTSPGSVSTHRSYVCEDTKQMQDHLMRNRTKMGEWNTKHAHMSEHTHAHTRTRAK